MAEENTGKLSGGTFSVTGMKATMSVHGPMTPDNPFYANIGRVASEWSHLEHTLDLIVWDLCDQQPRLTACITAQIMGVGGRCKAILSLGAPRT
jgi:hypothetical protein